MGYQTQLAHSAEEKAACELWWKKTFWNLFWINENLDYLIERHRLGEGWTILLVMPETGS